MDPATAIATTGIAMPLGLWEYLLGQGVFGGLTCLFLYLWLKSNKDVQELSASKAEELRKLAESKDEEIRTLGSAKDKELFSLQEKRLEEANTAADKRFEMQGKLIESTNSVTQAVLGLQEKMNSLRETLRK